MFFQILEIANREESFGTVETYIKDMIIPEQQGVVKALSGYVYGTAANAGDAQFSADAEIDEVSTEAYVGI